MDFEEVIFTEEEQQFINDIKAGMTDNEIILKYNLKDQLKNSRDKLAQLRLLIDKT
jgi:hypothetical protein